MRSLIAPLVLIALVVSQLGCGTAEEPREVPRLSVERLDGDGEFALTKLASSSSPTLLWFWAPWCEYCNAEATSIERLAADGRGELNVVSIGGEDDPARGVEFADLHRLRTPTLLFDEASASFDAYGIRSIPTAVLLDRDGRERKRWHGVFDPAEAVDAARDL
jgi:thiol-disulfide isomerase/thioredoxin